VKNVLAEKIIFWPRKYLTETIHGRKRIWIKNLWPKNSLTEKLCARKMLTCILSIAKQTIITRVALWRGRTNQILIKLFLFL